MSFKFNIFDGISEEQGVSSLSNSGEESQSPISEKVDRGKTFIPRTPESSKIERGERGALVEKMISALRRQVGETRENFPDSGSVVESESAQTDLENIDPDIRSILNSFGIFFFRQIPQSIVTVYGSFIIFSWK